MVKKYPNIHFLLNRLSQNDVFILRNVLSKFFYLESNFRKLGINPFRRSTNENILLLLKIYLNKSSPSFILILLFYLGSKIDQKSIESVFSKDEIYRFIKINILDCKNGYCYSKIMILPYKKFYFASDFLRRYDKDFQVIKSVGTYNTVYPVCADTVDLWNGVIKKKVNDSMDLCTGCGVHAILLSQFSKHVVGIDLNLRAINFAEFNLILNNIKNVDFMVGNLYEPIKNKQFDLIIANPPYLISPNTNVLYRDGGNYGYFLLKQIIEQLPVYLKPYGYCQLITSFYEVKKITDINTVLKKWGQNNKLFFFFLELTNIDIYNWTITYSDHLMGNYLKFRKRIMELSTYLHNLEIKNIRFGILTIKNNKKFNLSIKKYRASVIMLPSLEKTILENI